MSVIEKLLIVQEHDCRIRDLEKEMREIPEKKKEEAARLNNHKQALAEAEKALKAEQAEIKRIELENDAKQKKIAKLRQQQMEIKTNKEFKAIETEIQDIESEVSGLEDQELIVMKEMDNAGTDTEKRKKALAEEEDAVQNDFRELDKRASDIEAELKIIRVTRENAVKDVDPEWLKPYEKIFERKDRALVAVKDGVCSGCHVQLPPYVTHDAKKQVAIVTCGYCGRLLYLS